MMTKGYERLWVWFGLSRASWLTMPRILMHEMPDEWQDKMADLLEEWDAEWDSGDMPAPSVTAKLDNKFTRWPAWLLNYRRPDKREIEKLRAPHTESK
tara:strand:- start:27 stop:320 length:294 start_codon:yes stop_codon:yes gene_type:complete